MKRILTFILLLTEVLSEGLKCGVSADEVVYKSEHSWNKSNVTNLTEWLKNSSNNYESVKPLSQQLRAAPSEFQARMEYFHQPRYLGPPQNDPHYNNYPRYPHSPDYYPPQRFYPPEVRPQSDYPRHHVNQQQSQVQKTVQVQNFHNNVHVQGGSPRVVHYPYIHPLSFVPYFLPGVYGYGHGGYHSSVNNINNVNNVNNVQNVENNERNNFYENTNINHDGHHHHRGSNYYPRDFDDQTNFRSGKFDEENDRTSNDERRDFDDNIETIKSEKETQGYEEPQVSESESAAESFNNEEPASYNNEEPANFQDDSSNDQPDFGSYDSSY